MRQYQSRFESLNVVAKVVTFDGDFMAEAYVRQTNLKWPLLLDRDQELYSAYGMTRGSWWDIYGPASIWHYLKLIFSGQLPGRPGRDWRQLGGDVLIDPDGIVVMQYLSKSPHDRPDAEQILTLIESSQS